MSSLKGRDDLSQALALHPMQWVFALLSLVPLCVVLPLAPSGVGVAILVAWTALIWLAISFVRRRFHQLVPIWVAVYPYCYYLLSYPAERSIFTLDRAFVLLVLIEIVLAYRQPLAPLTRDVQISACLWGAFLLVCVISLWGHNPAEVLPSYRFLVDGIFMPAVLGLYAIRYFPFLKDVYRLHLCACLLGLGLFITGLIELLTEIDLFPLNGSEPMYTETHLRRADGPFEQQVILSVVGILAFFLILYMRQLLGGKISRGRLVLHRTAALAAFGAALIPLNRGLIFALIPVAVIECFARQRLVSRRLWVAFFSITLLSVIATRVIDPRLYHDRVSDPSNFYQRLAQHQETFQVVREYPILGVGFGLYHDVAIRNPQYMAQWNGIESMNVPHNVLMTVLSEEGLIGLVLYVLAQAFFIRAMWKIRKAYTRGWLAFVYCILVYVIIGLDYATFAFSDINLLYMFTLGVIYQVQSRMATEQAAPELDGSLVHA